MFKQFALHNKSTIKKTWEDLLKDSELTVEKLFDWHKQFTPWFDDIVLKEMAEQEFKKIKNQN